MYLINDDIYRSIQKLKKNTLICLEIIGKLNNTSRHRILIRFINSDYLTFNKDQQNDTYDDTYRNIYRGKSVYTFEENSYIDLDLTDPVFRTCKNRNRP